MVEYETVRSELEELGRLLNQLEAEIGNATPQELLMVQDLMGDVQKYLDEMGQQVDASVDDTESK